MCLSAPRRRSRVAARSAPTRSWPKKWICPSGETERVCGLAASCSSAAQRTIGRAGDLSTTRRVWSQRSFSRWMVSFQLRLGGKRLQLRHRDLEQAGIEQHLQPVRGELAAKQPGQFGIDPLPADPAQLRRQLGHRRLGRRVDEETELADEPGRPEQAKRILVEAAARVADRPDPRLVQIHLAFERIDQHVRLEVDRHRVDREIAPAEVVGQRGAEGDLRMAALIRVVLGAIGRDLDDRSGAAWSRSKTKPIVPNRSPMSKLRRSRRPDHRAA